MRILVTGSKGFVGFWLTAHLEAQGDEVIGIDLEVDITDPAAITDTVVRIAPEGIIHLAAQASVGISWESQADTYKVNTFGTLNLLQAAMVCDRRPRVLLISSSEVYGKVSAEQLPLREELPFAPQSPYAASKAASEVIGLQCFLGSGLEVVRARPFNHTGPGQRTDFVVPALAKQVVDAAASGADALHTGNLEARRDLTDVRDVVRAYRELLVAGTPGDVYNVCRGESVRIRDIAESLLAISGSDLPIVVDPDRIRPIEIPEVVGDLSRITATIGWRPEIPWEQTLRDVLEYCSGRPPESGRASIPPVLSRGRPLNQGGPGGAVS